MKLRQGFVSNSSSSSFIVIGTENNDKLHKLLIVMNADDEFKEKLRTCKTEKERNDLIEEEKWEYVNRIKKNQKLDVLDTDDCVYIGYILCNIQSNDCLEPSMIPLDTIQETIDILKSFGVDEKDINIYTGTMMC